MGATYIMEACRLTHAIPPISFSLIRLREYSRDRSADREIRTWTGATPLLGPLDRRGGGSATYIRAAPFSGTPHHLSSGGGPCRMGSLPSHHRSLREGRLKHPTTASNSLKNTYCQQSDPDSPVDYHTSNGNPRDPDDHSRTAQEFNPSPSRTLVWSPRCASVAPQVLQGHHSVAEGVPGESSGQEELG